MPVHRFLAAALTLAPVAAAAAPGYHAAGAVALGAPDRWDYVVADPATGRVYVAHGDNVTVVDGRAGKVVGAVAGMPGGTHGTGIVRGLGITDDGEAAQAVVFDPATLKVLRRVTAGADADGIAVDPASGLALVVDGDPGTVSVVDPRAGRLVATVAAGEELEYAVVSEGRAYVAGKGKGDVVVVDPANAAVVSHWSLPDCVKPHGIAADGKGHRIFVGCLNAKMVVIDSRAGRVVATLPIGGGSDAVAWDPVRRRVFSSNGGDGTITVVQQETPDRYRELDPIRTKAGGRTMAVDSLTGRLFVAAGAPATATPPRRIVPGSLSLMMFDPD